MLVWPLLFPLLIAGIVVYQQSRPKPHQHGRRLKSGPNTLPLLGNAIKFLQPRHRLFDWFVQCQKQFGRETFEISVPSLPPGVVINDPVNLEFVLKNEAIITKGAFFKTRSWDLFGHGIINASGELWKAQRKAGLKFFAGTNLEVMVDDVLPEVYDGIRKTLVHAADGGRTVDMAKILLDLTTSVVGRMAYDMEIDASSPFGQAFDYASDHIGLRFQNPLYWITELFTGHQFQRALYEVKRFGRKIVTNAKTRRSHIAFESLIEDEEPVFGTLIDSLIETFHRQPQVVADSALNFLSAGRDTTAQSLTWSLYALLRHPDALANVRQEIDSVLSRHTSSDDTQNKPDAKQESAMAITLADLQPSHMPFTTASFYESLRLYPPVPFEIKQCETDVTLPDGTFLPTASIVVWCIWALNRSETTFGDDADQFRPDRWLTSTTTETEVAKDKDEDENENRSDKSHLSSTTTATTKFTPKSPFEFPVFNGGPRACLGKKMAEVMALYVLTMLLREFDFEEIFDHDNDNDDGGSGIGEGRGGGKRKQGKKERISRNSLTLPMDGGLPCRVMMRKR